MIESTLHPKIYNLVKDRKMTVLKANISKCEALDSGQFGEINRIKERF